MHACVEISPPPLTLTLTLTHTLTLTLTLMDASGSTLSQLQPIVINFDPRVGHLTLTLTLTRTLTLSLISSQIP